MDRGFINGSYEDRGGISVKRIKGSSVDRRIYTPDL